MKKKFSDFFLAFLKFTSNLESLKQKDEPQRLFISDIIDCKKWGYLNARKVAYQNTYGQSTC